MSESVSRRSPQWLLEIALFVLIVVGDAVGWLPISQTLYLVPLLALALYWSRQPWSSIGFSRPPKFVQAILIGIAIGIAMEGFAVLVTTPLISHAFGVEPDYSELKAIQGNILLLALFLGLSWVMAAFGEEICFRGFLMHRLAGLFGNSRWAWGWSLVLSSTLFGWGHTEQGISGWVQEGLSGFLLGVVFLATGRNLTVPIVAHGVSNSVAFVLIYFGRYPGLG